MLEKTMPAAVAGAPPPPHYGFVDALRGLAFLAVLAFHLGYTVHGLPRLLSDILGRGYAGVELFFVVSCFTLTASLAARRQDRNPVGDYFLRRAFRILPMFWFAIALYMVVAGFDGRWSAPDGVEVRHIVVSALLLHGFDPHAINGVVPGGWPVATEVQFYLVLPLLGAFATTLRRAIALWCLAAIIALVAQPVIEHLLMPLYPAAQRDIIHQFAFYTLPAQLPIFACGLVLFRLLGPDRHVLARIEERLPSSRRLRAGTVIAFVLVVGLPLNIASASPSLVRTFPGHVGYGVLSALLVYALAIYSRNSVVQIGLRFLGQVSYSAYLLHFAVLSAVEAMLPEPVTSQPLLHLVVLGALVLSLTMMGAWLTYTMIEKPGMALGRRLIARLASRRAASVGDGLVGQVAG